MCVLQITMQLLNYSLNHRWAFSNVWGHLRKNKKGNNCNRTRMGKEHQKLKQSFICQTFWNVHLLTSWLQTLASLFMNRHSPLQSCWSWKTSARAKQGQYTSILPPVLMQFLPATNTPALTLCDKIKRQQCWHFAYWGTGKVIFSASSTDPLWIATQILCLLLEPTASRGTGWITRSVLVGFRWSTLHFIA